MKKYSFSEHLLEFKSRFIKIFVSYIVIFLACYYFSDRLFFFLADPLLHSTNLDGGKIIHTGLTEIFFSYLKISSYFAFMFCLPLISYHIYAFISPGLHKDEKAIVRFSLILVPLLFLLGIIFVYCIVMPGAWNFFLSFKTPVSGLEISFYGKISEYVGLSLQFFLVFGLAFELPVVIMILASLKIVSVKNLRSGRRVAIVIIFIISAIVTPPDVLSQICLAIPLLLLYELSIMACSKLEKGKKC